MRIHSPIYGIFLACAALATGCAESPSPVASVAQSSTALPKQTISLSTGITMKYVEMGNASGAPVILLHGYTDTSRSWYPTMQKLAALRPDLRLLALDQRGHGGSSMPSDPQCRHTPEQCFRQEDFAGDVLAFMDALGIDKASIAGHSMGSFVAQELALSHPERVERIVLVGTSNTGVDNVVLRDYILADPIESVWKAGIEAQGLTYPDDAYELTPLDADPSAASWVNDFWVVDPVADPAFLAQIAPETAATRLGTWIGAARALLATDNTARLEHLTVPALVIWPTQDAVFYESPDQENLIGALSMAADSCQTSFYWKQYGIRPLPASGGQESDIGHNVQWGAPEAVATDLASYLRAGVPTRDSFYANENDLHLIEVDPGQARIIHGPTQHCGN